MKSRPGLIAIGALVALWPAACPAAGNPPASRFVTANGARLEYLDWGGDGPPILFLAGLGSTAHVFNDLAPEFTLHYHCLGLTRRGFGNSEQTANGYQLDNLVQDIFAFAAGLDLKNLTLVGHSYGGTEAVRAAELNPELVRRVVLLDTAYDPIPPDVPALEPKLIAALTQMTPSERQSSLDAARTYQKRLMRNVWSDAAEADFKETVIVNADGSIKGRTPARISAAIAGERAKGKFHTTKIAIPALLIFAHGSWVDIVPGLHLDAAAAAELTRAGTELEAARQSQIEAFRRDSPLARIVDLEHTIHQCFIQRRERVAEEMQAFLAGAPAH